ncbi:MAG: MCE family protein [Bdellovibrionales bacterium]|nr:MCE family protein [Bdellovibrionales bacterium]
MEKPNSKGANTFVVGLFVFVAFLVMSGFVVFMGGSSPFSGELSVRGFFRDIRGLNVGAPVFYSGIQVGRVKGYQFPTVEESKISGQETGVYVVVGLFGEHKKRIQHDAVMTIATQGVLGDKVIVLTPGKGGSEPVKKNETLVSLQPQELGDYFKRGGDLVENVNELITNLNGLVAEVRGGGNIGATIANLEKMTGSLAVSSKNFETFTKDDLLVVSKSLRRILEKVDKGEGTLGALINDPSLHEDLRLLVGGAQRSKAVRFLIRQAISSGDKSGK